MAIIRGTTPTVIFTFDTVSTSNITTAYLVIKQGDDVVIKKDISAATVGEDIRWTLSQEETLSLKLKPNAVIFCDWKLRDGTRGRSRMQSEPIMPSGVDEVI